MYLIFTRLLTILFTSSVLFFTSVALNNVYNVEKDADANAAEKLVNQPVLIK